MAGRVLGLVPKHHGLTARGQQPGGGTQFLFHYAFLHNWKSKLFGLSGSLKISLWMWKFLVTVQAYAPVAHERLLLFSFLWNSGQNHEAFLECAFLGKGLNSDVQNCLLQNHKTTNYLMKLGGWVGKQLLHEECSWACWRLLIVNVALLFLLWETSLWGFECCSCRSNLPRPLWCTCRRWHNACGKAEDSARAESVPEQPSPLNFMLQNQEMNVYGSLWNM